jgi:hypothetical protein
MKIWIARDGDPNNDYSEYGAFREKVTIYTSPPVWSERMKIFLISDGFSMSAWADDFPEINRGECFNAEIVMKEKTTDYY